MSSVRTQQRRATKKAKWFVFQIARCARTNSIVRTCGNSVHWKRRRVIAGLFISVVASNAPQRVHRTRRVYGVRREDCSMNAYGANAENRVWSRRSCARGVIVAIVLRTDCGTNVLGRVERLTVRWAPTVDRYRRSTFAVDRFRKSTVHRHR